MGCVLDEIEAVGPGGGDVGFCWECGWGRPGGRGSGREISDSCGAIDIVVTAQPYACACGVHVYRLMSIKE